MGKSSYLQITASPFRFHPYSEIRACSFKRNFPPGGWGIKDIEQNIDNTGDGSHDEKHDTGREEGLGLPAYSQAR